MLVLRKFLFWEEDYPLGYISMKFWVFKKVQIQGPDSGFRSSHNSAHKMLGKFRRSWMLLIYLSWLSDIIDWYGRHYWLIWQTLLIGMAVIIDWYGIHYWLIWQTLLTDMADIIDWYGRHYWLIWQTLLTDLADIIDWYGRHCWLISQTLLTDMADIIDWYGRHYWLIWQSLLTDMADIIDWYGRHHWLIWQTLLIDMADIIDWYGIVAHSWKITRRWLPCSTLIVCLNQMFLPLKCWW